MGMIPNILRFPCKYSQAFRTMHRKPSQASGNCPAVPDLCGKYLYDFVGQGQPTERMAEDFRSFTLHAGFICWIRIFKHWPQSHLSLKKKEEPQKVKSKEKGNNDSKINHSSSLVLITRCLFSKCLLNSNIFQIRDLLRSHLKPFRKTAPFDGWAARWIRRHHIEVSQGLSPKANGGKTASRCTSPNCGFSIVMLVFGGGKIREFEKNDISDFCLQIFLTCILQIEHC